MDSIKQIVAQADRRALFRNQIEHAKARYHALNVLSWEGHYFELTPEFITTVMMSFVQKQANSESPTIVLDKNEEPVLIESLADFIDQIHETHDEAINDYYDRYRRLTSAHSNEELIRVS
jgi:hypothetical protein